jgi:Xaa-Pro aminopeptidase/Xaa-Pro dipeptidase
MEKARTANRIEALKGLLKEKGLDAALISLYENRRYYSLFTGSNGYWIISPGLGEPVLITDRRYTQQAKEQTRDVRVLEHGADRFEPIAREIAARGIQSMLIEGQMPVSEYLELQRRLPHIRLEPAGEALTDLRMIKDGSEIERIKTAVRLSERALREVADRCRMGMTEKDLADELNYRVSRLGAEAMSFGTIVAAGERGALAHGTPTSRPILAGDMVVVDFGAMWDGYCADLTRTLLFGDVPEEQLGIFDLVEHAFAAAFEAVKPGVIAGDVEEAHRRVFRDAGMEDYALKGLGHGIGLEIHEHPRVVIAAKQVMKPGMVFTIEPGLYLPGRCGVRTEDDVLVTQDGAVNLVDSATLPHRIQIAE